MTASAERRGAARLPADARRRAREAAVQMLYQWEIGRLPIADVVRTFWAEGPDGLMPFGTDEPAGVPPELQATANRMARGVAGAVDAIDPLIAGAAEHWRIERMNVLDRLILRLAVYEFLHEPDTPPRVVINEALELARTFSTDEAVRFINGILDAIRKGLSSEA